MGDVESVFARSITSLVNIETEDTDIAAPFADTAYAAAAAVVEFSASLNVKVSVRPLEAKAAPVNVGATLSTGVTETEVEATESPALFTAFK